MFDSQGARGAELSDGMTDVTALSANPATLSTSIMNFVF